MVSACQVTVGTRRDDAGAHLWIDETHQLLVSARPRDRDTHRTASGRSHLFRTNALHPVKSKVEFAFVHPFPGACLVVHDSQLCPASVQPIQNGSHVTHVTLSQRVAVLPFKRLPSLSCHPLPECSLFPFQNDCLRSPGTLLCCAVVRPISPKWLCHNTCTPLRAPTNPKSKGAFLCLLKKRQSYW